MEVKCPFLAPLNGLFASVLHRLDRGYLNNLSGLSLQGDGNGFLLLSFGVWRDRKDVRFAGSLTSVFKVSFCHVTADAEGLSGEDLAWVFDLVAIGLVKQWP